VGQDLEFYNLLKEIEVSWELEDNIRIALNL